MNKAGEQTLHDYGGHPTFVPLGTKMDATSNFAMLVFVVFTLLVTLSISQQVVPEVGSLVYWLLVIPSLLCPLLNLRDIARTAFTWPSILLVWMLAMAGIWHIAVGDAQSVLRVILMVLVLVWISGENARLRTKDVALIYLMVVLAGVFIYLTFNTNKWGPLPWLTVPEFGQWRVSFYPNIAYTASLSLFVFFVLSMDMQTLKRYGLVAALALYFTVTSFVRTALIGLALYLLMRLLLARMKSPLAIFLVAGGSAVLINVAIALSPAIVVLIQDWPFISRLFLHGDKGLEIHEVYVHLYRPWIWSQHLQIFLDSPFLMGWGNFDFHALKTEVLRGALDWSDAVSMPSRLLASHGLPVLLFFGFAFAQLANRARERDLWACACFAPLVLFTMQWGSIFHPSDPMFLLYFLLLTRGKGGFVGEHVAFRNTTGGDP